MGNGHGGARPGAGRPAMRNRTAVATTSIKRRSLAETAPPTPANPPPQDANPPTPVGVLEPGVIRNAMEQAVMRRRERRSASGAAANPFQMPLLPPGVDKSKVQMAMDSAGADISGWAAAQWGNAVALSSTFAEGMTWLGYTYLSLLTQRPEYRVISEIIAEECTRKWITITVADADQDADPSDIRQTDADPDDQDDEATGEQKEALGADKMPSEETGGEGDDNDAGTPASAVGEMEEPDPEEEAELEAKRKAQQDKNRKIKELTAELERLRVRDVINTWVLQDGFFGRSHIYIDVEGGEVSAERATPIGDGRNEISIQKVTKGKLRALRNVEPIWVYPSNYNSSDPTSPLWYRPDLWVVMATTTHSTRLLTLVSREVPDILKPAYAFGGLSLSQMAKPYIDNWLETRQSVNDAISAYSVMVLSTNLTATLQVGGQGVFDRVELFNTIRDNLGTMVVDKNTEDFKNVSAPLGTLDALQAQAQEHMASIVRIPLVKLLGIQPAGLNASSEGEIQTFDDNIMAYKEKNLRSPINVLIGFAQLNIWGKIDPAIGFEFEPMRQMTEKERGEIDKLEAETDSIRISDGVLAPEEVRGKIAADPGSPYAGIDVADLPEPPMEGAEGEGAPQEGDDDADKEPEEAGASDAILPFDGAADEASFQESKHPRDQDGKFSSTGGGGGGAAATAPAKPAAAAYGGLYETSGGSPKANHALTVSKVLGKPAQIGIHYRRLLAALIKEAPSFGGESAVPKLKEKLVDALKGTYENLTKKGKTFEATQVANTLKKMGAPVSAPAAAPAEPAKPAPAPAPAPAKPSSFPAPTEAELEKAKKNVALKLQFVPNAASGPQAQALVDKFNQKYEGKNLSGQQLVEKVNDFKQLSAAMAPIKAEQDKKAAEQAAKAQKDEHAKQMAEAQKLAKEMEDPEVKAHYQVLKNMGTANGLSYAREKLEASGLKDKISVYEAAQIVAYSGSAYGPVNKQMRAGVMTEEQYNYALALNAALDKLPPRPGVTVHGSNLTAEQLALYSPGMVIEERAFTSTGKGKKFSGNVSFEIHGKTGRDISKLSNHPAEQEVLFKSGTRFRVKSKSGNHIVMEEMDAFPGSKA